MTHTRLREALPRATEAALLCVVRALTSIAAYASGFRALSDDDYARISIAQRFAEAPSLDASHSSWLPAPFWIYGTAFHVFGTDLAVARATAIASSALATLLVYVAARLLGACRPGALVAAALSTLVPYSALLGIAAVPEVPCAALTVLGAATLASVDPKMRALGGLALSAACLSRYEAWPVAGVFAGISACDVRKDRALLAGAALALLGPAVWLLVGRAEHGSALFFVSRVTSYRRALGQGSAGALPFRLLEYPGLLLRAEPEVWALTVVVAALWWRFGAQEKMRPYVRTGLALLALLAFLVLGSVHDGVPTHHAARVLLPLWFFACVLSGHGLAHVAARMSGPARIAALAVAGAAALGGLLARPMLMPTEGFAERQLEIAAGSAAKRLASGVLAIDTPDYGYFAIQAAFGAPERCAPLADHDPRGVREPDPFPHAEQLARALREHDAGFLVATAAHSALVVDCTELWRNSAFVLFACPNGPRPRAGSR